MLIGAANLGSMGRPWYAHRMPSGDGPVAVRVGGLVSAPFVLGSEDLAGVGRQSQASDFHCVTTWSRPASRWARVPFRTVYQQLLVPHLRPAARVTRVGFVGADGYRDTLPLQDLLRAEVLLADEMDGAPLSRGNCAPLRLVAPAHYGYKNVKYIVTIELLGPPGALGRLPSLPGPGRAGGTVPGPAGPAGALPVPADDHGQRLVVPADAAPPELEWMMRRRRVMRRRRPGFRRPVSRGRGCAGGAGSPRAARGRRHRSPRPPAGTALAGR